MPSAISASVAACTGRSSTWRIFHRLCSTAYAISQIATAIVVRPDTPPAGG